MRGCGVESAVDDRVVEAESRGAQPGLDPPGEGEVLHHRLGLPHRALQPDHELVAFPILVDAEVLRRRVGHPAVKAEGLALVHAGRPRRWRSRTW